MLCGLTISEDAFAVERRETIRAQAGFTLAELIVASTLLTIVMGSVYVTFNTAIAGLRVGESNYEVYEDARMTLGLLDHELQAIPAGAHHLFNGTAHEIEFFALSQPMNVEDGEGARILRIRYRLGKGDRRSGRTLLREEEVLKGALPMKPLPGGVIDRTRLRFERKESFELAGSVEEFNVVYYWIPPLMPSVPGQPPPRVDPIIMNRHEEGWGLPQGVEMSLTIKNSDAPEGRSTFTSVIVFRGPSTRYPGHLIGMR